MASEAAGAKGVQAVAALVLPPGQPAVHATALEVLVNLALVGAPCRRGRSARTHSAPDDNRRALVTTPGLCEAVIALSGAGNPPAVQETAARLGNMLG